jgi:hypothetical protein
LCVSTAFESSLQSAERATVSDRLITPAQSPIFGLDTPDVKAENATAGSAATPINDGNNVCLWQILL